MSHIAPSTPRPPPDEPGCSTRLHLLVVATVAVLVCLLRLLPYLTARDDQPGRVFLGYPYNIDDVYLHADLASQAEAGELFFANRFSTMGDTRRLLSLTPWCIGTLARVTGLGLVASWMLIHALLVIGCVVGLYFFLGMFFPRRRTRLFAFVFLVFAGGLDGLVALTGDSLPRYWLGVLRGDLAPTAGWSFFMNAADPVRLAGIGLMLGFVALFVHGLRTRRNVYLVGACGGLLVLYLNQPAGAAVAIGMVVLWLFHPLLVRLDLRGWLRDLAPAAIVLGGCLPVLALALWQSEDPLLRIVMRTSHTGHFVSPVVWLAGFGLVLFFAVHGMRALGRDRVRQRVLFGWVGAAALLSFLPVSEGRALLHTVWLPLGILAVDGLLMLRPRFASAGRVPAWAAVVLVVLLGNSFLRIAVRNFTHPARDDRLYVTRGELQVARRLRRLPPGGVIASPQTGMWLPHRSGARVWMGHWRYSPYRRNNQRRLELLLRPATSRAGRDTIVENASARYLFYGPREKALGPPPVFENVEMWPVASSDGTVLFALHYEDAIWQALRKRARGRPGTRTP